MNRFYVGMGMGLMLGGAAAAAAAKHRRSPKSVMGRTLKSVSQMADSICQALG